MVTTILICQNRGSSLLRYVRDANRHSLRLDPLSQSTGHHVRASRIPVLETSDLDSPLEYYIRNTTPFDGNLESTDMQ